ncbi:MAG: lactate 2-monooxygenase [Anaerolineae bacterium]|nr:lactate 2-monooxygenase [Anaerolineae bacterium]
MTSPANNQDIGRRRQSEIYVEGMGGTKPLVPVDMKQLEAAARAEMSGEGYAYMAGGAGMESTIQANQDAFERWRIVPRMLRDVSVRDTSIDLFGQRLPSPFLLAPIGVLEMAHSQADIAVARAAAAEGVPMIFSNQASYPMEACAAQMGDGSRWFQLYWSRMDDLVESFVARAEACGCSAIVLTLDTTMLGWRIRDLDLAYLPFLRGKGIAQYTSDPVFLHSLEQIAENEVSNASRRLTPQLLTAAIQMARAFPGGLRQGLRGGKARKAVQQFVGTYSRPSLTWEDLRFLRELTTLPLLLKGILHPDDARQAIDHGMDGVIVSNHGGRQVDGAIASLDALPGIVEAVNGRIPVLMDSGIRSGAHAFKALALGAQAVCIGRPYAYGLAIAGEAGVRAVLQNLKADFDLTMGLAGCTSIQEITSETLVHIPA